ncbi:MAG: tyrosine-type recombinase/integrase [Pseudomonadota bacterium]
MAKMTVSEITALETKERPYKKAVDTGLLIRVATSGVKSWIVTYVIDGIQRDYPLAKPWGKKSDDGHLSLADARTESEKIRALARTGIDYQIKLENERLAEIKRVADEAAAAIAKTQAETLRQKQIEAENLTVQNLFDAWVPDTDRKDKGAEIRRLFQRDVLPIVGGKALKSLTEKDFRAILNTVVERGSNRMAVMLLSDLKQMFRWAEKRRPWKSLIEDNPVELLEAQKITADDYEGNERTRTLSASEIKELADKMPKAGLLIRTEIAMWIMLSCCCRIGEIIKARWEHVDFEARIWTIPKENAKNKNEHKVFLSDFALIYFHRLRELSGASAWCYPDAKDETHVCLKSTTKQIRDRQLTAQGRAPMSNRSKRADALILSGGDWVPHDLRRTGATMLQPLGVTPEVIERVLNHVEPDKLKRTYQTYDYADEKREAWRLLGDRLSLILNRADNVVMLRTA